MARYVNYIFAMTYNSGITGAGDGPLYREWMAQQTQDILRAVSGATWGNDASHPKPSNGVKVFMGVPGYQTATAAHNPDVENAAYASEGILEGINALETAGDISSTYMMGAVMYLHAGGEDTSAYARYNSDWWWWGHYWLGAW